MSAGGFTGSKYESETDAVHFIKLQPETLECTIGGTANDAPEGAIDSQFAAEVNRGARSNGLRPRKINVSFEADVPTGYRPYTSLSIPIMTKDLFEALSVGDEVVYAGGTGKVSSKVAESIIPGSAVLGADIDEPEAPPE